LHEIDTPHRQLADVVSRVYKNPAGMVGCSVEGEAVRKEEVG
jgi:hypothetical protein